MADDRSEFDELAQTVRDLAERVRRLERLLDQEDHQLRSQLRKPLPPPPRPAAAGGALESRIGSQWLNRIGVVVVLFGVAFLLRFVSAWVSEAAWMWLGVGAGLVIIAGSEWFRARGYRVLSLSLKATGIGVVYLSLWAGLELYKLLSAAETFTGLVVLAVLNVALAMREASQLLAALALIGGFLTPLLISVPSREAPLFFWLATLDCAAVTMSWKRDWWKLLPLGLTGTIVLSAVWYFERFKPVELLSAAIAATIFFVIFCAAALSLEPRPPFSNFLKVFEVVNAAFYFVALDLLLRGPHDDALAAIAFTLAAFYLWLASREHLRTRRAPRAVAVYGGLGITFVALALAVLLSSDWLSLGWFVEAAVVIAIGFWKDLSWVRWGALALLCAAVIKAFVFDVWQLSLGYRTLSFIGLGVLLLIISFAYQRYGFAMISRAHKESATDANDR